METEQDKRLLHLYELRGSEAWKWLQNELANDLDNEFTKLEDGVDDFGQYEYCRGRIAAIKEIMNITDV